MKIKIKWDAIFAWIVIPFLFWYTLIKWVW